MCNRWKSGRYLIVGLAIAVIAAMGPADALTVSYTVQGLGPTQYPGDLEVPDDAPWGPNGYPGDTVELQTYTGSLDLTPGTSYLMINTLLWTVDYTYGGSPEPWADILLPIAATRGITLDGQSLSLSQTGTLRVGYDTDYLSFDQGATTSFFLDGGYRVDVTALAVPETGAVFPSGGNPWLQPDIDMMARFDVTVVPEPATMILLGLGLLGAVLRKRLVA